MSFDHRCNHIRAVVVEGYKVRIVHWTDDGNRTTSAHKIMRHTGKIHLQVVNRNLVLVDKDGIIGRPAGALDSAWELR